MRKSIILFGHEIRIRPEYDVRMHITQFPEKEYGEVEQWKHDFPIDKRVNVYIVLGQGVEKTQRLQD